MHLNGGSPRPVSGWLAPLDRELRAELEAERLLCLKVAVLRAGGFNKSEITRKLDVAQRDVEQAEKRLKPHVRILEREDDRPGAPGPSGAL